MRAISVRRRVDAPAAVMFELLADPTAYRHARMARAFGDAIRVAGTVATTIT